MWRRLFRAFSGLFAKNDFSSENAKIRIDKDKHNRSRIAAYCQNCSHCKFDPQRGLVCALTDDYGDFQHECDQFEPSEAYIAKKRAERIQEEKEREQQPEIARSSGAAIVLTYIFCLVSMWHDDTPAATIQVLLAAGITLAGSGGAYYFYCRSQLKKITYGLLSHKKIVKLLHIEGYRPQLDAGGDILFQHDGNNYIIRAGEGHFMLYGNWICSDHNVEQLRTVANEVMEELRVVKVYANYDEEKMVAIVSFSVEAFIKYEVELQAQLSSFIHLLKLSSRQFFDVLQKNKPIASAQRRQSIYNREYGWFADVVDAVTDQKLSPELLSNETILRQGFLQDCAPECMDLWDAFRILRVERYGDYKLFLYQFPEPKEVPEALYGAALFDTKTHRADYYTLEYSYNGKWVLGATSRGKHINYGEVDVPDLNQFIMWIFSSNKQPCHYTDLYRSIGGVIN